MVWSMQRTLPVRQAAWLILLGGGLLSVNTVQAAVPEVTALYPSGAKRGSEVVVKLEGKVDPAALQLRANVPGIELLGAEGKDSLKLRIAEDTPLGVAWFTFHNAEGLSSQRPFVIGQLPEAQETEPNNKHSSLETAVTLPLVMNGVLSKSGDVDTFAVDLKAGETLVAMLDALQTLGSPMDGLLQIADEQGFVIVQNDDAPGFDPRVTWTAARDGRYFVRVFAFPSAPDSSIRFSGAATYVYRLTLSTGPVVAHWSPAAITTGQAATVHGSGWNLSPTGIPVEPTSTVTGIVIPYQADVVLTAPVQSVPYPVVAAAETNAREQPQTVTLPVCMTGRFATRKSSQAWKFAATKGQKLHLEVCTESLGSPLDAVVQLLDASGKVLQQFDDASRQHLEIDAEFSPPADGDYTLIISERFWHGGPDYVYTCCLSPSAPDATLTVDANHFLLKAGEKLEVPVKIERRFGMSQSLSLTAADLPEGVTAEAVTSEPKGESSKNVKLILQSTRTEPWLGPITIVGSTSDEPKLERRAQVSPVARQIGAPEILLQVLPVMMPATP